MDAPAPSKSMGATRILFLTCVIAVLLYVLYTTVSKGMHKSLRTEAVKKQCALVSPEDSIFVAMAVYSPGAAQAALNSLFARAFCPRRVSVGICFYGSLPPQDVLHTLLDKYPHLAQFSRAIKFCNAQHCSSAGAIIAAYDKLYGGEKYVLTLDAPCRFADEWDRRCIDWLREDPWRILTGHNGSDAARYPYFDGFDSDGLPQWTYTDLLRQPRKDVPVLTYNGGCAFAMAALYKDIMFDPECGVEPYFSLAMAARLYTQGCTFSAFVDQMFVARETPVHKVSYTKRNKARVLAQMLLKIRPEKTIPEADRGFGGGLYALGSYVSLEAYEAAMGVYFRKQDHVGRAALGLTQGASSEEILAKFGNMTDYYYYRRQVSK